MLSQTALMYERSSSGLRGRGLPLLILLPDVSPTSVAGTYEVFWSLDHGLSTRRMIFKQTENSKEINLHYISTNWKMMILRNK